MAERGLSFFERYLSLWVFLAIVGGTVIGLIYPPISRAA